MTMTETCPHGSIPKYCITCAANSVGLPTSLGATIKTRDARYGGFENVAEIAQKFKKIMQAAPSYAKMTDVQKEGMEMVLHKCARLLAGDPSHRDSWHDIQGYAKLVEDRLPPEMISEPIIRGTVINKASGQAVADQIMQHFSGTQTWPPAQGSPRADGFAVDGT